MADEESDIGGPPIKRSKLVHDPLASFSTTDDER